MKTQEIYDLVQEVINFIPEPYPNDIIDQVCSSIERNNGWLNRYDQFVATHGKQIANQWIGRHVFSMSGFNNAGPALKAKSSLIKTYSWLS